MKWSVDDISVDKTKRKGKPVITDHGVFYSPIAGDYLISVKDSKVQANVKVTVKGDPQPSIDKLIEKYKPFSYGTLSSRDVAEVNPSPNKIGLLTSPDKSRHWSPKIMNQNLLYVPVKTYSSKQNHCTMQRAW